MWLTRAQVGAILGVSATQVSRFIADGLLDSRAQSGPGAGSLDRRQVRALARRRQRDRDERERRAAAPAPDRRPQPPDHDHDWLTTGLLASILGITRAAVRQQLTRDHLAHTWHDGWRWVRRDLLKQRQVARLAQQSRRV